ncbi:MAG: DUF5040 domain-containing protein [Tannerellaceae bacterium]|nr:DUF5040 domain-containing protein [Tannerellaceae bacterium]
MKKINLLILIVLLPVFCRGEECSTILLAGASFASPNNRWFEMGCTSLGIKPLNRAVGGENISHTAVRMQKGELYTFEEFEEIDAFVIMHVHEKDVYNPENLKDNYLDYPDPMDNTDYAACFDYVIKRYIADCYNLKDNPDSKYYGSKFGKPAIILLCTHWNDSRIIYNTAIRKLAEKWGFPVVEFDKNIGFSTHRNHPVTGKSFSLLYTDDQQMMHDREEGWHPHSGDHVYIQQRMAAIFADTVRKILLF